MKNPKYFGDSLINSNEKRLRVVTYSKNINKKLALKNIAFLTVGLVLFCAVAYGAYALSNSVRKFVDVAGGF